MPEQDRNPLETRSPEQEAKIRERAYYLWQADGCPHGRDQEYWERARELQAIADSTGAAQLPNPITDDASPGREQPIEEAEIQQNLGEFPHAGMRDQGDRAETPMTRRTAERTPVVNEHEPELEESELPTSVREPAQRRATPLPPKRQGGQATGPSARDAAVSKPTAAKPGRKKS